MTSSSKSRAVLATETWWFRVACTFPFIAGSAVHGQVVLDGKFGSGSVAGPNYNITSQMGRVRGNNLFHSFSQFDIASGEVARFTGPANIQNILSRVTGGNPSSINGTIRSEISGANLFLLNPSGIIFGPNAAIDVSGSFAASTANYLKLADGARFVASLDADDSGLSTAPVSAFGFLSDAPASITVDHSTLQGSPDGRFSLVGGDIRLDGATIESGGGQIQLASVRTAGELPADLGALSGADFKATFSQQGQIVLENSARVDASGDGGGRIVIRGGSLLVDNSVIQSNTEGAGTGQGIDVAVGGDLTLVNGGQINSVSTSGVGAGGDIAIDAQAVRLDGGGLTDENFNPLTQISTSSGDPILGGGAAQGGDISIDAGRVELVNSAQISSATYGAGDAGRIEINADSVFLDALLMTPTQINANTWQQTAGGGSAGDIVINANRLEMQNGATVLAASAGSGQAGRVNITSDTINLRSGSIITAGAFGSANGGDVHVTARELNLDGYVAEFGIDLPTGIQAVTTSDLDPATGGNLHINVDRLSLDHGGSIFTTSIGLGAAGNIEVTAGKISLAHGSSIRSESLASGTAGTIDVESAGNITLRSGSSINTSAPFSSGGDIRITAGREIHLENSQITASAGLDGGNITLAAPDLISLLHSTVTAEADSTGSGFGNGGNLSIDPVFLLLNDSALISRSSFGNGGNITIVANYFFQSFGVIDASAPFGLPGTVTVTAPEVDVSGVLIGLPGTLVDVNSLLRPDCAVRLAGDISSFTVLGQGGLPLQPGGFIPSGLVSPRVQAK